MTQKENLTAANGEALVNTDDTPTVIEQDAAQQPDAAEYPRWRPAVQMSGDDHESATAIAAGVAEAVGGRMLFRRGGEVVERCETAEGVSLRPVTKLAEQYRTIMASIVLTKWKEKKRSKGDDAADAAKDDAADSAKGELVAVSGFKMAFAGVVYGHLRELLPEVTRISAAPVVRPDGTIATQPGFDEATGVYLALAEDIRGIEVPDDPTPADIDEATTLLRDVLFEMDGTDGYDGWLFGSEADRNHAIAFLLTALLRSAVPTAPMFVLDGLQRGVGKGALCSVVHRVAYGSPAPMGATPTSDTELEKRISADLLAGKSLIFFDEIMDDERCVLEGARSLTAALTAETWSGRRLGYSEALTLPQASVWAATGNNVRIPGDLQRRILQIRLTTDLPGADERSNFRRNLGTWVPRHRRELLTAALTLIRAWYAQGQPEAPREFGFVSFEEWQRVIGGICAVAGLDGFLRGVLLTRQMNDPISMEWMAHLEWVYDAVQRGGVVTSRELISFVQGKGRGQQIEMEPPPEASWDALDARKLGRKWSSIGGKWFGHLRIRRIGKGHGNVVTWRVEKASPTSPGHGKAVTATIGGTEMTVTGETRAVAELFGGAPQ